MKKSLLIAGDSFSADWTVKYKGLGWVNLFNEYQVTNLSQAGVSEYKIVKQLESVDIAMFDNIVVCHTSPYRIPVKEHPIHNKDILHQHCDLIYNDLNSVKKTNKLAQVAVDFFESLYDMDYALFVHDLIIDRIVMQVPFAKHITFFETQRTDIISFHDIFQEHRGLINHLNDEGNSLAYKRIQELLNNGK